MLVRRRDEDTPSSCQSETTIVWMLSAVLADCVNRIATCDLKRNKPEPIVAIETLLLTPGHPIPRWLEENLPARFENQQLSGNGAKRRRIGS